MKVAKKEIEQITIFGGNYITPDGTCIRDYIHVEDVAQAHLQAFDYIQKYIQQSSEVEY